MTEERTSYFEAVTAYNQPITTFETQAQGEVWQDCNTTFPGAQVYQVTVITIREPIKRRKLRLAASR